ncbi:unnamed protein product [Phytomonas sp. EM1]|nr:unnamed protein product [Phytomonas sp. EM1]|eukprot:CCW62799.1 unnamed protein product [Phytomonas sp. isolate EM1]
MSEQHRPAWNHLKSERQAAFSNKVRKAFLDEGRKRKDEERARMEAYRRLCAEEGIESKRLKEYDQAREEASARLKEALEAVDYDQSLTNNEKKKRKYNLKRKFAATTVNESISKKYKPHTAVTDIEIIQKKKEEMRKNIKQAREQRNREKASKLQLRKKRTELFKQRTKRGQPVLASRVESLLQKITRES